MSECCTDKAVLWNRWSRRYLTVGNDRLKFEDDGRTLMEWIPAAGLKGEVGIGSWHETAHMFSASNIHDQCYRCRCPKSVASTGETRSRDDEADQ